MVILLYVGRCLEVHVRGKLYKPIVSLSALASLIISSICSPIVHVLSHAASCKDSLISETDFSPVIDVLPPAVLLNGVTLICHDKKDAVRSSTKNNTAALANRSNLRIFVILTL
ncbi:hypothetical protein D3C71_1408480 [compost metagenome]